MTSPFVAWNCPVDYESVTKVLFVSDPAHQTALNIKETGEFALCVPHASQGCIKSLFPIFSSCYEIFFVGGLLTYVRRWR